MKKRAAGSQPLSSCVQYNDIKTKYLSAMCNPFHYLSYFIPVHQVQNYLIPATNIRRVQSKGTRWGKDPAMYRKIMNIPSSIHQSAVPPRGKIEINLILPPP